LGKENFYLINELVILTCTTILKVFWSP